MNTDYIRSLLIMFNNRSMYEIETALAIYEFEDKDVKDITDDEISKMYDLIRSQDEIFNDYVKEEIIKIKGEHEKKEFDKQKDKEQEDMEK